MRQEPRMSRISDTRLLRRARSLSASPSFMLSTLDRQKETVKSECTQPLRASDRKAQFLTYVSYAGIGTLRAFLFELLPSRLAVRYTVLAGHFAQDTQVDDSPREAVCQALKQLLGSDGFVA